MPTVAGASQPTRPIDYSKYKYSSKLLPIPKHYEFIIKEPWNYLNILGCRASSKTFTAIKYIFYKMIMDPNSHGSQTLYIAPALDAAKGIIQPAIGMMEDALDKCGFFKRHKYKYTKSNGLIEVEYSQDDVRRVLLKSYPQGERLRGFRGSLVVMDEPAECNKELFEGIIQPIAQLEIGRILLIGTPIARTNIYYENLLDSGQPAARAHAWHKWHKMVTGADETTKLADVIPNLLWKTKIVTAQDIMSPFEFQVTKGGRDNNIFEREYMCNYKITAGAGYRYAEELNNIPHQINSAVTYDKSYPVYAAWDLGKRCLTVCWIFQIKEAQIHFIDYMEGNNQHFSTYLDSNIKAKEVANNYRIDTQFLPHDAKEEKVTSDASVVQMCRTRGYATEIITTTNKSSDIQLAIDTIYKCHFNAETCTRGLEHLRKYELIHSKYDSDLLKFVPTSSSEPHYDAADAFRYAIRGARLIERRQHDTIKFIKPNPYTQRWWERY